MPEDNIESIFDTAKAAARTYSYGGGCGFSLSKLRPRGMKVNNAARTTTGSVSFMDLYSMVTGIIGQGNRTGALMLSLDVSHPDIEEFIDVKNDLDKVTKANISVMINNDFMKAVEENKDWELYFKTERGDEFKKIVNAKDLFRKIAKNNYDTGEPGQLFIDRVNNWNLTKGYDEYKIVGTNPCGEQPLSEYASCLLGSLNLSEFVDDPFTDKARFNEEEFIRAVHVVVRAMDDVLDENIDRLPLQEQRDKSRNWRQIGLGHLGLADTLIKLQMTYGDEDSLKFSDRIGKIFINECIRASALLAKERGVFPKYNYQSLLQSDFYQKNIDDDVKKLVEEYGMRHCSITSIAPTGSIGTMLAASTGIEPNFRFTYIRKTESMGQEDRYYKVHSKIVKDYLEVTNGDEDNLPEYFIESQDIKPLNRIKMQSTWQKYIDTAISSTINLPEETTIEEIEDIYMNAWKYGLKGITVFRDNCKRVGILSTKENEDTVELKRGQWKSLAEDTYYVKRSVKIGCGKLKLFIGYSPSEQTIQDLYIVQSGKGGCTKNLQALAITISAVLRVGGNLDQLHKAYSGIEACNSFVRARAKGEELSKGTYCGSAILNEVKEFLKEVNTEKKTIDTATKKTKDKSMTKEDLLNNDLCPECKTPLDHAGSCVQCPNCGYSKCN